MRTLSSLLLLLILTGCSTIGSGTMYRPGLAETNVSSRSVNNTIKPSVDYVNTTALQMSDINAINEAIAVGDQRYWAPQEEVLQQAMEQN